MGVNLDELERLYKAATPGEWHWDTDKLKGDPLGRERARICTIGRTITEAYYPDDAGKRDVELLCALHNAFPALLALARDGERYRWLREHTSLRNRGYGPEGCWLEDGTEGIPWDPEMERKGCSKDEIVDAAIDAARKGEKP